jgi:hypothetical protein
MSSVLPSCLKLLHTYPHAVEQCTSKAISGGEASLAKRAGRYGPYYHRAKTDEDAWSIQETGELRGTPRRGSGIPQPQAFVGPLPNGTIGIEFFTDIKPHGGTVPGYARWMEGDLGVVSIDANCAKIQVTVTKNTHKRPSP